MKDEAKTKRQFLTELRELRQQLAESGKNNGTSTNPVDTDKAPGDSEAKCRVLLDGSTHGILATDVDTKRFVFANPSICHMLGYSEKELLDLGVEDIHPKDSLNLVLSELEFQYMGEKKLSSGLPCLRKDGTVFFADVAGALTSIRGRKLAVGFFSDATERVKHTQEMEHLNRLYTVLSRVSQAVVRATSSEKFLEQACREVVEGGGFLLAWIGQLEPATSAVAPRAFQGEICEYVRGISVYADTRPEGRGPTGTCIREGRPSVHNDFLHSPLTFLWRDRAALFGIASSAAFPIQRGGQAWGALTIYSDEVGRFSEEDVKLLEKVSGDIEFALDNLDREFERKFALEELNKYRDHLEDLVKKRTWELAMSNEQLSREIEERKRAEQALESASEKFKFFAYSVAHDLKSPAIGIHGLTRRLSDHARDVLDEKGRIYCDQIVKVSEHIAALVEKINIYIATKETAPLIETVKISDIFRMLRDEFSVQCSLRRVEWFAPESAVEIRADRLSMFRIFRNLIDNSLKYGGTGLTRVSIGYEDSDGLHTFSVSDDGKGLHAADAEKIFGLFQRNETSRGVEGAGLGLAIVKEIAEQHGGRVWAEPGDKNGITFYVSISKNLRAIQDTVQNPPPPPH